MSKKGRMVYVPPCILDEADLIMKAKNLNGRSEALRQIAKYSQVGREAEQILKFDFNMFKRKRRQT